MNRTIIINTDDCVVVYFNHQKYAEGHILLRNKWIRLGTLLEQAKEDILDIIEIYISPNDVSDENILSNFPEHTKDLNIEIISIINKAM